MRMAFRPLSPHLSIYRFAYTMALSILHRATGVVLSLGLLLLVAWLVALAAGPATYARFAAVAASWPMQLVMAGLLVSFCYHFANGIRHLFWDIGWGLERREARRSARIVMVATALAAATLLYVFLVVPSVS
jgi:succinate dehydrogenase / fumarate reductase cytochrome b subunit